MMLPRSTMATASQVRSTSSRRCDDSTTVRPSATSDRIMSRISCMPAGSSPFMGSSRISSWGSPSRQAATPRRWRMPIEYFDTRSSARWRMPDPLEGRSDAVARRRLACRGQDLEVLPPGQVAVEAGLVDDGPDPGQRRGAVLGHGVAEQRHRAGVGVGQSQQHPDERGLARAVRAEVAEGAPPGDEELDAVHGDVVAEALGQPVGLDGPGTSRPPAGGVRREGSPCSRGAPGRDRTVWGVSDCLDSNPPPGRRGANRRCRRSVRWSRGCPRRGGDDHDDGGVPDAVHGSMLGDGPSTRHRGRPSCSPHFPACRSNLPGAGRG